jgi:Holliday junction resolvasome RuvABC DNA-binding subunit
LAAFRNASRTSASSDAPIVLAPGSGGGVAASAGAGADAVSALLNLGFRPAEANAAHFAGHAVPGLLG